MATKNQPATESSQEPQTVAKPSRNVPLEGVRGAEGGGIVEGSSIVGSASSPRRPPPEGQPRLKSTRPEAGSNSRPSSTQSVPGPVSCADHYVPISLHCRLTQQCTPFLQAHCREDLDRQTKQPIAYYHWAGLAPDPAGVARFEQLAQGLFARRLVLQQSALRYLWGADACGAN